MVGFTFEISSGQYCLPLSFLLFTLYSPTGPAEGGRSNPQLPPLVFISQGCRPTLESSESHHSYGNHFKHISVAAFSQSSPPLPYTLSPPTHPSKGQWKVLASDLRCVFQATDKRKALEETMSFTTQALASVAYQVGNLAGHTLRMLDLQAAALRQVEAHVSTLGQVRGVGSLLAPAPNSSAPTWAFSPAKRSWPPSSMSACPTPAQKLPRPPYLGASLCLSAGPCCPLRPGTP